MVLVLIVAVAADVDSMLMLMFCVCCSLRNRVETPHPSASIHDNILFINQDSPRNRRWSDHKVHRVNGVHMHAPSEQEDALILAYVFAIDSWRRDA